MKQLGGKARTPQPLGFCEIDIATGQRHAIIAFSPLPRHEPAEHIRPHALGLAVEGMLEATPPEGYAAACGAIAKMNQLSDIRRIAAPTLVICGAEDPATPLAHSVALRDAIADSRLVVLPTAHLSNVEKPHDFAAAVGDFLRAPTNLP